MYKYTYHGSAFDSTTKDKSPVNEPGKAIALERVGHIPNRVMVEGVSFYGGFGHVVKICWG